MKKYKRSSGKHILAAVLFCLILGMGIVCHADEKGTVTVASAKIRASADPASEQLGSVAQGKVIDIIGETTGTDGNVWYQVYVDANTKGYIRGDLVQKEGGANSGASTTTPATTSQDLPETSVTPVEARKAAIKSDTVSVRKGAGTSYAKVGTAKRGTVVTVTGEATASDGAKWYQVSIMHQNVENIGFIRSDLVTFDDIPADVATSNIVGEGNEANGENGENGENPEGQPQEGEEQPEEQPQPEETPQPEPSNTSQNVTLMNGGELSYVMPGFTEVTMKLSEEEKYDAYQNGAFYIIYGRNQAGEEGWFLFDSENQIYQRYVYTATGVETPSNILSGSLLPMIALVIIIVILLAIIGLLFLKLREYRDDYEDDEDDDYSDDDDIEDLEEEEDYYEDEAPVRRPQRPQPTSGARPQPNGQPARRPQPSGQPQRLQEPQSNGQPQRRPQPQPNGQPQRPQPTSGARPQPNGQPARRPQPSGQSQRSQEPQSNGQPVRRPQPQQSNRPQPNPNNRPAQGGQSQRLQEQPRAQQQRGTKARPMIDSEKEDMEFIDI